MERPTTELPPGTWTIDPARTTVTATAKKLGLFSVPARLAVRSGRIEIGADGQVAAVEVVVDAASYESKNAKRNEHVRSDDFLDADQHPDIAFTATEVTETEAGYRSHGTLSVKGTTSPLTIEISDIEHDAAQATLRASGSVDRVAAGVAKMPSFIIGRDIELEIAATASTS